MSEGSPKRGELCLLSTTFGVAEQFPVCVSVRKRSEGSVQERERHAYKGAYCRAMVFAAGRRGGGGARE